MITGVNLDLLLDIRRAREVINAQHISGHLDFETYTALHHACDSICEVFGVNPARDNSSKEVTE